MFGQLECGDFIVRTIKHVNQQRLLLGAHPGQPITALLTLTTDLPRAANASVSVA